MTISRGLRIRSTTGNEFGTGEHIMIGTRIASLLTCLVALASIHPALAQITTGSISGIIADSSGAAVVDAKVTATEISTNAARSVQSATDGSYQILFLPIGTYKIEVNAAGFKKFEQTGLVLDVNRNARVDAALQVGTISETVEVKADAAMVETTVPTLGQTVNSQDIE